MLAQQLLRLAADWSPLPVLLLVFRGSLAAGRCCNQFGDHRALAGPGRGVAGATSTLPPEPLVVCTALGAVASFLVPIGHHGNLLI
ncbi:MAG: hypothetical protein U1F18_06135 [Steroidobacteraceae bacterium]